MIFIKMATVQLIGWARFCEILQSETVFHNFEFFVEQWYILNFFPLRTIIDWSESHDRGYGKFQTANMEDLTFNDLNIKLGFPYLYCHQGDCEHVVVITDIRWVASVRIFYLFCFPSLFHSRRAQFFFVVVFLKRNKNNYHCSLALEQQMCLLSMQWPTLHPLLFMF